MAVLAAYRVGLKAPDGPATTMHDFVPVAFVLAAAFARLYTLLFQQSATAFGELEIFRQAAKKRGEKPVTLSQIKYGGISEKVLRADRSMGNYLEQLMPFVFSLIGYAAFVNAKRAAMLGWAWTFFRMYYPIVFSMPFPTLLLSTMPAYACIWYMLGITVYTIAA